ncbi:MAG: hypothetical protein H7841_00095 [Magnetospirillum sp. WYHS-4]
MAGNIISLLERRLARKAAIATKEPSREAVSLALRYLMEDAMAVGEDGLVRMLDLAAVEAPEPFFGEGYLPPAEDGIDEIQTLDGLADCLSQLETEAKQAGDPIMPFLIRIAGQKVRRRSAAE